MGTTKQRLRFVLGGAALVTALLAGRTDTTSQAPRIETLEAVIATCRTRVARLASALTALEAGDTRTAGRRARALLRVEPDNRLAQRLAALAQGVRERRVHADVATFKTRRMRSEMNAIQNAPTREAWLRLWPSRTFYAKTHQRPMQANQGAAPCSDN